MAPTPENAPCWHNRHRPREICELPVAACYSHSFISAQIERSEDAHAQPPPYPEQMAGPPPYPESTNPPPYPQSTGKPRVFSVVERERLSGMVAQRLVNADEARRLEAHLLLLPFDTSMEALDKLAV